MFYVFRISVVLLYSLALVPTISAQDRAAPNEQEIVDQIIKSMDKDADGSISESEASADLKLFFANYDKNSDGKIDGAEAVAIAQWLSANDLGKQPKADQSADIAKQKALVKQWILSADKDGDGKVNQKEAPPQLAAYFGAFDTNADKTIDADEAIRIIPYIDPALAKTAAAKQKNDLQTIDPQTTDSEATSTKLTAEQLIASMDRNGNKSIDSDEAPEELAPYFDALDSNSDGNIDSVEALALLPHITAEQTSAILAALKQLP